MVRVIVIVRKHRAPYGALRLAIALISPRLLDAREHRASKSSHAIPLVQTSTTGKNRVISMTQLQVLNELMTNCMRHFPTTLQDERHKVH